jgi:3-oxoacyl-[acyl-carrier-protein] synthase-3
MDCYLTRTGAFLPGPAIENDQIQRCLGVVENEEDAMEKVLTMNGITQRHYAQDGHGNETHDVYALGTEAVKTCLADSPIADDISFLSTGTTYSPLAAPGFASILHSRLSDDGLLKRSVEISSHSGICSSGAAAVVSAVRAVSSGEHRTALCAAAEHPSAILKAGVIQPIDDRAEHAKLSNSQWFMSMFLRYMLSDGAGAFLVQDRPALDGPSLKVNWTFSRSFAHDGPLCMKLENETRRLTQDVGILSKYLYPFVESIVEECMDINHDEVDNYTMILPHLSSFFFRRKMEKTIEKFCKSPDNPVPYWTNLATAGNTGSASIYIMLDEYIRTHELQDGQRLLLFVPESGQFNYVLISLTVVLP